jgi:transcriptional regulator with XRE-family HTH domain
MRFSTILQKKEQTIYQQIAKKFNVSSDYVGKIARGERAPQRGIGKDVLADIEELLKETK